MRSVRRVGEAGTHPTSTAHVSGPIQIASNGETVGKNQVNSYTFKYIFTVDAVLLAVLDSDLVVCREVAKHFHCPYDDSG